MVRLERKAFRHSEQTCRAAAACREGAGASYFFNATWRLVENPCRLALSCHSSAETLYQGAVRCHVKLGRAADAMRIFRRCREQLSIVLGVRPAHATQSLVDQLTGRGV